jgi:TorA maturation chaperone TorD
MLRANTKTGFMSKSLAVSDPLLPPEEQDRADLYALLAALLLGPDDALLQALAGMPRAADHESELARAWDTLIDAAGRCAPGVQDEFDALFVATGTPRINPYQCWYVAGWLMDSALAELRDDLRALGLARASGVTELEDHLGALCEAMRVLVQRDEALDVQQDFFRKHLAGWSLRCLDDIAAAPGTDFYRAVAGLARAFFALEAQAFALDELPETESPRTPARHASPTTT